jgi:predicted nucleotide-binding protein
MPSKKKIIGELIKYKEDFNNVILPFFARSNVVKGNIELSNWLAGLYKFVQSYSPAKARQIRDKTKGLQIIRDHQAPPVTLLMQNVGDWVLEFLDLAITEIESNEEDFSMPNSIKRKVFVVHGRNTKIVESIFTFLRALDLHPIEWSEARKLTGNPSPTIGNILDAAFSNAQSILVLMTGDEEVKLKEEFIKKDDPAYEKNLAFQPRPNVIFEAGMAWGKDPKRTILIKCGNLRPMSDISGVHYIDLANTAKVRHEIAARLRDAGCDVDTVGSDWLDVGNFEC